MARVSIKGGPKTVSSQSRPSFVLGSRPPDLRAPRFAQNPQANITKAPPRISPVGPGFAAGASTRQYGKKPPPTATGFDYGE